MKECIQEVFESAVVRRDLIKVMTDQVLARINTTAPVLEQVQYPPIVPSGTGAPLPASPVITSQSEDEFWTSVKKDA
jgi:hypothetical protein